MYSSDTSFTPSLAVSLHQALLTHLQLPLLKHHPSYVAENNDHPPVLLEYTKVVRHDQNETRTSFRFMAECINPKNNISRVMTFWQMAQLSFPDILFILMFYLIYS